MAKITINLSTLYQKTGTAKIAEVPIYIKSVKEEIKAGEEVVLTGAAPVWLYLVIAHALHGIAKKLIYTSPVSGNVLVFDHDPN